MLTLGIKDFSVESINTILAVLPKMENDGFFFKWSKYKKIHLFQGRAEICHDV
jgi:hypothetical protein